MRANDGSYWMVDEYRPAIYHFDGSGMLIDRFVPEGSNSEEEGIDVGVEALPEILGQRRANRGFEAVARIGDLLYALIESPIDYPDVSNDASFKAGNYIRIVEFDTVAGETIGQYLYEIDGDGVDKIGDAVALEDGSILVIERDATVGREAHKYIYRILLDDATNIHEMNLPVGLELQNELGLALAGIRPVAKELIVDLNMLGYTQVDNPEGLALVDENTLAVLNDNDFGLLGTFDPTTGLLDENPAPTPVVFGLISLRKSGLDASNKDDAINIRPWPVLDLIHDQLLHLHFRQPQWLKN